jgi:DNA-binding Lrp family transcriptional regulator
MTLRKNTVKACVLVFVTPGQHYQVANRLASIAGVKAAFPVMGGADVVARIEVRDMSSLTAIGTEIGSLPNVVRTETLIAAEE